MLQKNYSTAVVGRSYLSFIYGIELLRHGHSVLILDDERLQYGELFSSGLTEVDLEFLKAWGSDREIICLESVKDFCRPRPYVFHFSGRQLFLGGAPWDNLRELFRKVPDLFPFQDYFSSSSSEEELAREFNQDFYLLCHRLGANGFRFKSLENLSFDYLQGQCPGQLKTCFQLFRKAVVDNKDISWQFLYFSRILFHKRLASQSSQIELFHLFLCLLSPHYLLDDKSLLEPLVEVFMDKGGHFKETKVREWKFYKSLPWSMELASFEGIIHPQKISFLGSWPLGLPLKVKHKGKKFLSVHFKVSCQDPRLREMIGTWHLWGQSQKLATDLPFWHLEVKEDHLTGQYLYREKVGSKLNFFEGLMKDFLFRELEEWLPGIEKSLESPEFERGREVYLDQSYQFAASPLPKLSDVKLYDFSVPIIKNRLKNVTYFGPLKGSPLGLYGQLLELKEISKYY